MLMYMNFRSQVQREGRSMFVNMLHQWVRKLIGPGLAKGTASHATLQLIRTFGQFFRIHDLFMMTSLTEAYDQKYCGDRRAEGHSPLYNHF